jgi:hypothetical protein
VAGECVCRYHGTGCGACRSLAAARHLVDDRAPAACAGVRDLREDGEERFSTFLKLVFLRIRILR